MTPLVLDPVDADPQLGPMVQSFLACVCATLADAGRPVCACCLVWGDTAPPADFCDCACADGVGGGQAWVRVIRMDPASINNRTQVMKCQPMRLRAWIEAGVYRCVPTSGASEADPPSCEQRSDSAWGLMKDARLLRFALSCCEAIRDHRMEFMSQDPVGVRGGCAGVTVQFTLDL